MQGTAQLQVIVTYYWIDRRYAMPLLWEHIPWSDSGIDLTRILTNDSVVMWLPQVTFPDASQLSVQSATLSLQEPCLFIYTTVYDMTLVQPLFDFRQYPQDSQQLVLRYTVVNYDSLQLQMYPSGIFCSYLSDGSCSFAHNPLWTWDDQSNYCTVYYDQREGSVVTPYTMYTVQVSRNPKGLVIRLVVPLALLILMSSLTFWLDHASRVDVTITLLLAISALYIVIIQNIPMVGYLTNVDDFVITMFLMLFVVTICHQIYSRLFVKCAQWPLRLIAVRLIEVVGRSIVLPLVIFTFAATVGFNKTTINEVGIEVGVLLVSITIFCKELQGLHVTVHSALKGLLDKVNKDDVLVGELSWLELVVVNLWIFRSASLSSSRLAEHLAKYGSIGKDVTPSLSLKNAFSLNAMLRGGETMPAKGATVELSSFQRNSLAFTANPAKAVTANPIVQQRDSDDEDPESK